MSKAFQIQEDDDNFLCCCEYLNWKNERSHLLGCCCDCQDLDEYFERKLTNQSVPNNIYTNMYLTFQDRCRLPWMGGAKKLPLDDMLPVLILPILAMIATINFWCISAVFLTLPFLLCYCQKFYEMYNPQTKFFFAWTLTSFVLLMWVFEALVIPQLEIVPSENCIFLFFLVVAIILLYWTKRNDVKCAGDYCGDEECITFTTSERYCKGCNLKQPPGSLHCNICRACVARREYHCVWLDCCIGEANLKAYKLSLFFLLVALLYFSYLTLTTVCHPFLIMDTILIPDDCRDVFFDVSLALCFVAGTYSFLVGMVLLFILVRHWWISSLGLTYTEWLQHKAAYKNPLKQGKSKTPLNNQREVETV